MADRFIEIDVENEEEILALLDAQTERQRRRAKDIVDDLGDFAMHVIRANTPEFSGYTQRHIGRTPVMWRPGGSGGGGSYEVVAGIKAGRSRHPIYVEVGTGIYGKFARIIIPLKAQYMIFFGTRAGRMLAKRYVKGQRAQRYFYASWRELQIYARGRLMASGLLS